MNTTTLKNVVTSDLTKAIGVELAKSAASTAAGIGVFLAAGYTFQTMNDRREKRAAKKAAKKNES